MDRRGRWIGWAVVIGICTTTARGYAQNYARASSAVELDQVLVSPRRIPGLVLDTSTFPGAVTVVTAAEIRRSGASTAQDVIARAPGVTWSDQQGFGLGADSTVNLRGIVNSSRTNALVLVDGIRQNRLTGDEVHWQAIPADHIERIEMLRGGGGLVYGEGALGGVINIVTKQDSERPLETEEEVAVGSFGWEQYHASARGRSGPARYSADYTRRLVTGYRESSWSRLTTIRTHAGWDLSPQMSTTVHVTHSDDTTAFPGLLTEPQSQERQRQTNAFHGSNTNEMDQVSLDVIAGPWEGWSSLVTLFWNRWLQTSEDSIQFGAFTNTPSRGVNVRTNYEWTGAFLRNLLVNGIELAEAKATTGDRDAFAGPDSESTRGGYGLYVEDTLRLGDRLSLIGGLRYDKSRYQESLSFPDFTGTLRFQGFSPHVGLTYAVVPLALDVFASYARPFKAPNVDDFSSRLGSFARSNADLKPQQADTYEVGMRGTRAPLAMDATAFYTRINDEILFNSLPGISTNQNFDTRRVGIELAGRMELQRLRASAAYTFVDVAFSEGQFVGNTIPGTPAHTLSASLSVSPLRDVWITLDWRLVQDFFRFNDLANNLGKGDNYSVLNLLCRYDLSRPTRARYWPNLSIYLKIDNLTNEEYATYQSSNGVNLNGAGEAPMPPLSFTGGVTMRF